MIVSVAVPVEKICAILGARGPIENVTTNWPLVEAALAKHEILTEACAVAAIATIAVETGCFAPIKERGGPAYFTKLYEENTRAAEILAVYFHDHSIHNAAAAGNWELVRRRVNGGLNGWADFKKYVDELQ